MCVLCTQWYSKSLLQVQDLCADIEFKQTTSGFLGASRHVYSHQNTAGRSGRRLKRQHCGTPVSRFVVQRIRVSMSLFAVLSRENEVITTLLTVHVANYAVAPYKRILGVLQTCTFPD
ncbi:hypothetical protein TNCV_506971 [Trichonephila clavipes]|nr:hypothetical protein TNCV_506971 [Trichonephila clavipes]